MLLLYVILFDLLLLAKEDICALDIYRQHICVVHKVVHKFTFSTLTLYFRLISVITLLNWFFLRIHQEL